jgi:hypothetical protein
VENTLPFGRGSQAATRRYPLRHKKNISDTLDKCQGGVIPFSCRKGEQMAQVKFCECGQYCLNSKCVSSDSGLSVKKCWCAECKEVRAEIKQNAGKVVVIRGEV